MGLFSRINTTRTEKPVDQPALPLQPPVPAPSVSSHLEPKAELRRRLLFVESDPTAIQEFSRLLHGRSQSWEVAAAANAAEAMALLEQKAFDAVVSSARLPGGSGVDFLNDLGRRFPRVVRLIRHAPEDKPLLRGFVGWPPAHLTKEMDAREIEAGLQGAFQLAEWISNPSMKALLPQMQRLPTVPELYTQVMDLLASPDSSTEDVGQLISRDPALTAKMLQMVNSAMFALVHPVSNAVEAVLLLGAERTKALILVANTSIHFDLSGCAGFSQDQFWHHSLATAGLARSIMQMETQDARLADQAFTAGLLHDVGKLLFAANLTQKYSQTLSVARHQKMSDEEAERLAFGTSHAELGACLLGTWRLPLELLRAISWHHAPSNSGEGTFSVLTAIHVANVLDHEKSGTPEDGSILKLDHRYLTRLDLNERWMRWRDLAVGRTLAA